MQNWDGSVSSRFYWLFSGEISNYRISICIYLFTPSKIEEHNLIISPINNLIVLYERNQIAVGGQNNRQNQIPWLLIYYVRRLSLNQAIPYSDNQNIFGGNILLCLRCYQVFLGSGSFESWARLERSNVGPCTTGNPNGGHWQLIFAH